MGLKDKRIQKSRPDIYNYHDLHDFLIDWFEHLSEVDSQFSLRQLALKTGIHHGHLSRILRRHVTLTQKTLNKLKGELSLSPEENNFLEALRALSESKTQEKRIQAFKRILRHRKFKLNNNKDIIGHEYLSHWYYPVVRELVKLPQFQWDPKWIRQQLGGKITTTEAQLALQFLEEHGFLIRKSANSAELAHRQITCRGGIYRLAASEYHEQLLEMARDSIHEVDRDMRQIMSHTLAMSKNKVSEVRDILREAVEKIQDIHMEDGDKDSVYQISLLAFPLTASDPTEKKE